MLRSEEVLVNMTRTTKDTCGIGEEGRIDIDSGKGSAAVVTDRENEGNMAGGGKDKGDVAGGVGGDWYNKYIATGSQGKGNSPTGDNISTIGPCCRSNSRMKDYLSLFST